MNEKNEIRDGWYMLNWKVVNETAIWEEAPPHYLIYVKDGLFYVEGANFLGYEVTKEMILHEYFNYGDVVYVRDRDTREWEKAKYLNYSNERFSHMAVVDNCSTAWNYCISEAEWKEKEVPTKPDTTSELQNTPDINVEPPKFMMFTNTDKKKTKLILEKEEEEEPKDILIYDGLSLVVNVPIHDNEKIIIARCGDSITYETERMK